MLWIVQHTFCKIEKNYTQYLNLQSLLLKLRKLAHKLHEIPYLVGRNFS